MLKFFLFNVDFWVIVEFLDGDKWFLTYGEDRRISCKLSIIWE